MPNETVACSGIARSRLCSSRCLVSMQLIIALLFVAGSTGGLAQVPPDAAASSPGPAVANFQPAAAAPGAAPGNAAVEAVLPAFSSINSCVPFNLLIRPPSAASTTGAGAISLKADPGVSSGVQVTIANGVLAISLIKGFQTAGTIEATVTTPDKTSLESVGNFGMGDVVVASGFEPANFTVNTAGQGGVYVFGLVTPDLHVTANGVSTTSVNGQFTRVKLQVGGTAKVYVTGAVSGDVSVSTNGISTTFVQTLPGSSITGTADSLAKVLYTDGTCSVKPSFQLMFGVSIFGDPCVRVEPSTAPTFTPMWSCGLQVNGTANCASLSSATDSASAPVAAASPAPGSSAPNTNTVTGPAGTVTTSTFTSGPGASASSSGLVGGSGMPPIGLSQMSTGGNPASIWNVRTADTASSPFTQGNDSSSSASTSATGGNDAVGAALSVVYVGCAEAPSPMPLTA